MKYLDVFSPKNPPMKKLENIIKELRGISNRTKQEALTPYIKENDLFTLLDDLESSDPEMFLATGLISIFGLRIAELAVLKVREGNLYVGHVKNNRNTTNKKRIDRRVFAMDLIEKGLKVSGYNVVPNLRSFLVKDLFEIYKDKFGLKYKIGVPRVSEKIHENYNVHKLYINSGILQDSKKNQAKYVT